jgi:MarR family 2-MHQ and catechol resistance regulon transcriptional repressor
MGTHYQGTESEIQALDAYIKLSRAADALSANINRRLKDYNLSTSQFGVLEALYHLGPMTTGQLGHKVLKSSGNMTLVIDNLVKRAWVRRERKQDDRRCIEIQLTDTGEELLATIFPSHVRRVEKALSVLDQNEQRQLASLCRKLGLGQDKK